MKNEESLKRILVPVDGSVSSLMAQETAAIIAKKTEATVTVLHVMPEWRSTHDLPSSVRNEIMGHVEQYGYDIISKAKALFTEESINVEERVFGGDPASGILDLSGQDYSLVVMGACGEHEKDTCMLGSVTKKIIRHTRCPTFVVKKLSTLFNLLVCTDGSVHSIEALDFTAKLAEKIDANIALLNVQERRLYRVSPKTAEDLGQRILSKTLEIVGKRKLKISTKLEFGVPSDVIVEVAENENYDLIAIGSRGLGTADRFLLGSVSDDVSHKAKCSVLIIPPEV